MEPVAGELEHPGEYGSSLLPLPGSCPWDDDDEPLGLGGIKPKSSPIPRRRSSESFCSDDDSQPPPSSSRRVSFADAFGLSLVSVKQFDSWAACCTSGPLDRDLNKEKDHFLSLHFTLPQTPEELLQRVREQKLELESLELLPGTTTLKGIIRVLNLCFDKLVFIRMSLDCWNSHFDLLAEYIPGLSDGDTDSFSFKLTLVPPFGRQGARVDFCLRYDTPFGNFWANNNGQNYVLFCCERAKEQDENEGKHKRKSCLKSTSLDNSSKTSSTSSTDDIPEIILNCAMAAASEAVQKERMQEECMKLQEENSRNCNSRTKRRAERLAKVQQYFAQREEKDLEPTKINTGEADAMTNVNEWTPAIVEVSSNFLTPEINTAMEMKDRVSSLPADPMKLEGQESTSDSVDTDSKQALAVPIQILDRMKIPVLHPELTTARPRARLCPTDSVNHHNVSQALESSQEKETFTGQTVSVTQHLLSSDISVSTCVEKAWECFEKGAVERVGSREDRSMENREETKISGGKASHGDDVILENNPEIQPFGQSFKFETVVAPLYHQVFERIETERRDLRKRNIQTQGPAGNLEDGSLNVVTYQSYPRAPSWEASTNVCMFEKHAVSDVYHGACKQPQAVLKAMSTTEKNVFDGSLNDKLVAEIQAAHDTHLTDTMEGSLDANVSELEKSQTVTPTKEGFLKYRLPFQQENSPNSTLSSEDEALVQEKQTPNRIILQNEHLLGSTLEDTEYSLDNMSIQSDYSSEISQQEPIPVDCVALTIPHALDSTTTKTPRSVVSDKLPTIDGSNIQISFETTVGTDVAKIQSKEAAAVTQSQSAEVTQMLEGFVLPENTLPLQHSRKSLEESQTPIPQSALFHAHISSETQIQNPDNTFLNTRQKASGSIHVQNQISEGTNLNEDSDNMQCYTNDDSHHVFGHLESNNGRNDETDACGTNITDTETGQVEKSHTNPEKTTNHVTLPSPQQLSQICKNKEHRDLDSDFSNRAIDFKVPLGKDKATLMVSDNDNPEDSSTKIVSDTYKDNERVEKHDKGKEQKSSDMKDHHSIQCSEETQEKTTVGHQEDVEEQQQEKEQQKPPPKKLEAEEKQLRPQEKKGKSGRPHEKEQQQRHHGETEQPETDEEMQLWNDGKCEDDLHYSSDDKDGEKEKMEKETEEQKTVSAVRSVTIAESNTNDNSFKNEVCLDVRQKQQSECRMLEQDSEETVDKRYSIREAEDISCETDSSQQAPSQNREATCSGRDKLLENNFVSIKLIDKEKQLCCQIDNHQSAEGTLSEVNLLLANEDIEKQERNCLHEQSEKNMDDSASTESLTDDEMELYLHSLRNTQQSVFRDCMSSGNYSKRASKSRTRTMPSPMPSISESMDEDQPNASLEDLINEEMVHLERDTLPLMYEEEVIGPNVLWWREFFSSDNMSKMFGYTSLFLLFILTAYYYDFIACFGLYILALYWLYVQGEKEHLKDKRPKR